MDEIQITDTPYLDAVRRLKEAGYEFIRTPISWRKTADYLDDVPEYLIDAPVGVMSSTSHRQVAVWPWIEGGMTTVDQPLAILRADPPSEGLGVYAQNVYVNLSEFGEKGPFVACQVYLGIHPEEGEVPVMTIWEPVARTAAQLSTGEWTYETEEEYTDMIRGMCCLWFDRDFRMVWQPGTQYQAVEPVTKTPPDVQ